MKLLFLVFALVSISYVVDAFKIKQLQDVLDETRNVLKELKKEVFHQQIEDGTCEDTNICLKWKKTHADWKERCKKPFFERICKKSCDLCPVNDANCKDNPCHNPRCDLEHFQRDCKKSCRLCGSGGSYTMRPKPELTKKPTQPPTQPPTKAPVKTTKKPGGSASVTVSGLETCTEENKGHCECADISEGFQTYVFKIDGTTRCFTVFQPPSRAAEKLPVVLSSQCYGKDRLGSIGMTSATRGDNVAAARYGFARIGLSTPDGGWTFGNDGIVNDETPMPCSESDSKDIAYVKKVFEFIKSKPSNFDSDRVYTEGFSQNSMFSAYIGFCFSEHVVGIWQGGSGLALTGEPPNLPGCQAQCTASNYAAIGNCNQCKSQKPCTECQYWPIYPCYQAKRPVIDCVAEYNNDFIASGKEDPEKYSTSKNMYKRLINEGHSARLLRFKPSDDGTIKGGHKDPQNKIYWKVGCLGITSPCSAQCEASFITCMSANTGSTAEGKVKAFDSCVKESVFKNLTGCTKECAPTYNMLKESEEPVQAEFNDFGAIPEKSEPRPNTSKCTMEKNKRT